MHQAGLSPQQSGTAGDFSGWGQATRLWAYADLGLMPEGSNPAYGNSLSTMFTAGLAASLLSRG